MTRPEVAVCIPYISTGCMWREKARQVVIQHWKSLEVPVVFGYDQATPANRARARNRAASLTDAEVLFFADADMWVDADQFWEAAAAARSDRFTLAYTTLVKLNKATTQKIHDYQAPALLGQNVPNMSSGAFAVSRALWEMVGGQDERFEGWGGEDRSFMFACDTIAGKGERIAGRAYHLWHPRSPELSSKSQMRRDNLELGLRYKRAAGIVSRAGILPATKGAAVDSAAMLALLSEDGGPLSRRGVASAHG